MGHAISLSVVLAVLWLLWSGHYHEPLILGLGVASVAAVVWIAHRMDVVDHEGHPIHLTRRVITYFPWLAWQIVKSNIDVADAIVRSPNRVRTRVLELDATQPTPLGRVILANSITLTPGTVTIALEDRRVSVHALTDVAADGVADGEMDRRVTNIERG